MWRETEMKSLIAEAVNLDTRPVAVIWSDDEPESAVRFKPQQWGCVVSVFAATATRGIAGIFDRQTYGCWGGGVGLGFGNQYEAFPGGLDCFCRFLSTGNKDTKEGGTISEQMRSLGYGRMAEDFVDGGLSLEDSVKVGTMLEEEGIDAIELSGGTPFSGKLGSIRKGIKTAEDEAYFKDAARAFKMALKVPLLLVGGIRTFQQAERLLEEKTADYISMSRPFIREPALVQRWISGDLRPATCLSDSLCFKPTAAGEGIYCVVEKKQHAFVSPT